MDNCAFKHKLANDLRDASRGRAFNSFEMHLVYLSYAAPGLEQVVDEFNEGKSQNPDETREAWTKLANKIITTAAFYAYMRK